MDDIQYKENRLRELKEERLRALKEEYQQSQASQSMPEAASPEEEGYTYGQRGLQYVRGMGAFPTAGSDAARNVFGKVTHALSKKPVFKSPEYEQLSDEEASRKWSETPAQNKWYGAINKLGGRNLEPTDLTGKFLDTAGQFSLPMSAPENLGIKALTKWALSNVASGAGASAAMHLTPALGEEGSKTRILTDLGKAIIGSSIGHKLVNGSALSRGEQAVVDKLTEVAGSEEAAADVLSNIQKYESKIGYEPTLAEVAENPNIAQLQRAREGIIGSGIAEKQAAGNVKMREALAEVMPEAENVQALQEHIGKGLKSNAEKIEQAKAAFEPRATAESAGSAVQESLHGKVKNLEKIREIATQPEYEIIENLETRIKPSQTLEFINKKLKNAKGSHKQDLEKVKKLLQANEIPAAKESSKPSNALHLSEEEARRILGDKYKSETVSPRIGELKGAREAINSEVAALKTKNQRARARTLTNVSKSLEKEMEAVPLEKQVRAKYEALSTPISDITDVPSLKKVIARDVYGKKYKLNPSSVPEIFTGTSSESIDNAKELLKHIDKNSHELLKNYSNGQAIEKITDSMGRVKLPALETFKKSHAGKGLEAINPELFHTKLKNLENAQLFANQYYKKTRAIADTFYKNEFNEFVGSAMNKNVGNKIFNNNSLNNTKELLSVVAEDTSGNALNGLRRYTSDYLIKNIENAGMEGKNQVFSYDKLRKFKSNHKKALDLIFDKNQNEVLNEIEDIVKRKNYAATVGTAKGSPTTANIQNSSTVELMNFGKESAWVKAAQLVGIPKFLTKKVVEYIKDLSNKGYKEALDKSLTDPKYAEFLLSNPLKNKESANAFINFMDKNKQVMVNYLGNIKEQEEKD